MTVYRGKKDKTYRYDFWYRGTRYADSTGQTKKKAAEEVERTIREEVERAAAGLPSKRPETPLESPKIQDWAGVFLTHKAEQGRKVGPLLRDVRIALKFFGAAPAGVEPTDDEPYHNLTLRDVEQDPLWVDRFEQWMKKRQAHAALFGKNRTIVGTRPLKHKIGPSARNHLRSAMSGLFKVALLAKHKPVTKVTSNPWMHEPRDPTPRRITMVTTDQLRAWIRESAYHVKLALAIAALAPKLRLSNVLALRWGREVDLRAALITIEEHKTRARTGLPLVVPISPILVTILQHGHARRDRDCPYVITYHGTRVRSIKTGLRRAAQRAHVPYGLRGRGATFHTLRHYAATTLAALGLPEGLRKETMGHTDVKTTQIYTHLAAHHQREPLAQLAAVTPLADLFVFPSPTNSPTTALGVTKPHGNTASRLTY